MTTYNTGNPVPSADARDRYDNSQTLDEVVNGDSESYSSRTGKQVISLGGMNSRFNNAQDSRESAFNLSQEEKQEAFQSFLDGTGWSSLGAYAGGISITSHTQTVDYLGQPYQLKPSIPASLDAPYVTTGVWATEGVNFKLVGDNSLRQDIVNKLDPLLGAGMLGLTRVTTDLSAYIGTAGLMLSTRKKSLWEYIGLITDKPSTDPDTWDWTPAFQALADYACANHKPTEIPDRTYKITSPIRVKNTWGWQFLGGGISSTVIVQHTDNTPIFDLGVIAGDAMYGYAIMSMSLTYASLQPKENTNATPIKFSQMGFEGTLDGIRFLRGSYGIKVVPGVGGPWGQSWNDLEFTEGLSGGAMDWTGATNSVPNNNFGRIFVNAGGMAGPIFKEVRGYNWVWGNLEILDGRNCQWWSSQAGTELTLGAIKLELADYTAANTFLGSSLFYAPASFIKISQVHMGGTFCKFNPLNPTSLFNVSSGKLTIDSINHQLSQASSNFYLFSASTGADIDARISNRGSFSVPYSNVAGSATADSITVRPDRNDRMSQNKGDANYTVAKGDPSIAVYETAFTAPRTETLPADDFCFNGLKYTAISRGAVNGTNTLSLVSGGFTKASLTIDKSFVELTWRRGAVPHSGWVVTGYGVIP